MSTVLQNVPFALAGFVLAAAHSIGVAYSARLYGRSRGGTLAGVTHVVRWVLLGATLVALGAWSKAGLLATSLGFAGSHPLFVAAIARRV